MMQPAPAKGHGLRFFECDAYDDCLMVAGKAQWRGFHCEACPRAAAARLDSPAWSAKRLREILAQRPKNQTEPAPAPKRADSARPNSPRPDAPDRSPRHGGAGPVQPREAKMSQNQTPAETPICKHPGCGKPAKMRKDGRSMGYCAEHWQQNVQAKGQRTKKPGNAEVTCPHCKTKQMIKTSAKLEVFACVECGNPFAVQVAWQPTVNVYTLEAANG